MILEGFFGLVVERLMFLGGVLLLEGEVEEVDGGGVYLILMRILFFKLLGVGRYVVFFFGLGRRRLF